MAESKLSATGSGVTNSHPGEHKIIVKGTPDKGGQRKQSSMSPSAPSNGALTEAAATVPEQGSSSAKEKEMRTAIVIVMTLALAAVSGCLFSSSSARGGSVLQGEGFKIVVPTFNTKVKQGEAQSVAISLQRGEYFKRDVRLEIKPSKGIDVEPTNVLVRASDKPDVQLRIAAPKDAALGEYNVSLKGTPGTGEPTSIDFTVEVVAP